MASGESTSNTQDATPFYRWFLILFSLFVVVMSIINSVYYNNVLNQYTAQPDVQQDVGKGWARAMYGINIALAVIGSLVLVFQLLKVIMGKNEFDLWERIKKFFKPEKTADEVVVDAAKKAGTTTDIAAAVADGTAKATKDGATPKEAAEAGERAGLEKGGDKTTVAKVAAYIAGSPKRLAKFVKAKFAKKEPGYCGAPAPKDAFDAAKINLCSDDIKTAIKEGNTTVQALCEAGTPDNFYKACKVSKDVDFLSVEEFRNKFKGKLGTGVKESDLSGIEDFEEALYPVKKITEKVPEYCGQPQFVKTLDEKLRVNDCVDDIRYAIRKGNEKVEQACMSRDFTQACGLAKVEKILPDES